MNFPLILNNFTSFAQGIGNGFFINSTIESEAATRQGRNHYLTGSYQSEQINMALTQVLNLLNESKITVSNNYWIAKNIIALSPIGLAYIANKQNLGTRTRQILNFVQNNLGKLSLAITLVTTSIFLYIGHTVFAISTIAYLGIGLLDRRCYLPNTLHHAMNRTAYIFYCMNKLFFADTLTRVFALLDLVSQAVDVYFKYKISKMNVQGVSTPHPLIAPTKVDSKTLVDNNTFYIVENNKNFFKLQINKSHVNKEFMPSVDPKIDLNDIIELGESIDWSKHQTTLIKKLDLDPRWREVGILQNKTPIVYFKENLRAFVSSIKERKIREGQPNNYDCLEKYCRFIVQELKKCDEIAKVDALLEMGVGGDYCGSGKFRVIEERVSLMITYVEGLPLEKRILGLLQQKRTDLWQQIYSSIWWKSGPFNKAIANIMDANDIHNYNVMLNLSGMAEECGIPNEGAINDRTAEIPPILRYFSLSFTSLFKDIFWGVRITPDVPSSYRIDTLLKTVSNNIGAKNCIPKPDVYEWWRSWINRQDLDADTKEELLEELTSKNPKLYGIPFEIAGVIQPRFIMSMLLEMGILTT